MGDQLLVRNVPDKVREWISSERERRRLTQQELLIELLEGVSSCDQPSPRSSGRERITQQGSLIPFAFVDLFAGIGGFRIALERLGGKCVFSCEWDKYSQKTYSAWFGDTPAGDIRKIRPAEIPDHDVLAAGFPCQPFSIAGVSKKKSLGHAHGFECENQGNLFFQLATIISVKRPPVLFLENVKNLLSHDKGRTWVVILDTLQSLDYVVFQKVIDAAGWVPQHRERIYIVCFDRSVFGDKPPFRYPEEPADMRPRLRESYCQMLCMAGWIGAAHPFVFDSHAASSSTSIPS